MTKSNYVALRDLLEGYHPSRRGFVNHNEMEQICAGLQIAEMNCLELQNLRDFVVLYFSLPENHADHDRMSAIVCVIDHAVTNMEYAKEV